MALKPGGELLTSSKVAATVGMRVCRALIGMHAFTGCDTVSAFVGRGKTKALKLLISHVDYQDTFLKLDQEWVLSQELVDKLETFTCLLYAPKLSSTRINELRCHLFCAKKGEIESHQLPPCRDCFLHMLSELTTRLEFGRDVYSRIRKCRVL